MRGRNKQRKMRAQFRAPWLTRLLRPIRYLANRTENRS